jgi:hypothetical protein
MHHSWYVRWRSYCAPSEESVNSSLPPYLSHSVILPSSRAIQTRQNPREQTSATPNCSIQKNHFNFALPIVSKPSQACRWEKKHGARLEKKTKMESRVAVGLAGVRETLGATELGHVGSCCRLQCKCGTQQLALLERHPAKPRFEIPWSGDDFPCPISFFLLSLSPVCLSFLSVFTLRSDIETLFVWPKKRSNFLFF